MSGPSLSIVSAPELGLVLDLPPRGVCVCVCVCECVFAAGCFSFIDGVVSGSSSLPREYLSGLREC